MKKDPMISVIVPVYNIMEYLPRCVVSITKQTYQNLEILLIDDGSTDKTGILCEQLAEKDKRIRVYHKENGGTSSARNLGIVQAKGEYLGFVDSDDYIEPEMYELLIKAIQKYHVKAAQVGRDEIDSQGHYLPDICIPPATQQLISAEDFLKELLMHRGDCSFCTKLIHRDFFMKQKFPEGVLNEDFYLLVKLLPAIGKFALLPQQTYHVFYRIGSNTRKEDREHFSRVYKDNVDNADMVLQMVKKEYPSLEKRAVRFGIFQRLDYLLHIPIRQMTKENKGYCNIVKCLRKNWWQGMINPYLTKKNKIYHTLFAIAPKKIRVVHKHLKRIK